MNRYELAFLRSKKEHRIAFIPFAVAGDPTDAISEKILKTYIESGADILEIGYPFSDPIADGPVNQRAAHRAIQSGLTPSSFFSLISRIRKITDIPIGLLLYANILHHIGFDTFCKKAAKSGIDSLLVADMPPEEAGDLLPIMRANNLKSVFIISELTSKERIQFICDCTDGFIYVVSRLGTTGVQNSLNNSVNKTVSNLHKYTDLPLCVGFGISSPDHITKIKKTKANGVIVGSKLVQIIEQKHHNVDTMLRSLKKTIKTFKRETYK